jgi:hypothetical protein
VRSACRGSEQRKPRRCGRGGEFGGRSRHAPMHGARLPASGTKFASAAYRRLRRPWAHHTSMVRQPARCCRCPGRAGWGSTRRKHVGAKPAPFLKFGPVVAGITSLSGLGGARWSAPGVLSKLAAQDRNPGGEGGVTTAGAGRNPTPSMLSYSVAKGSEAQRRQSTTTMPPSRCSRQYFVGVRILVRARVLQESLAATATARLTSPSMARTLARRRTLRVSA